MESTVPQSVGSNKRIMLVSDFYYGRFEGDGNKKEVQKTNHTFKCQSCLKILKNNIRYEVFSFLQWSNRVIICVHPSSSEAYRTFSFMVSPNSLCFHHQQSCSLSVVSTPVCWFGGPLGQPNPKGYLLKFDSFLGCLIKRFWLVCLTLTC